MKERERFAILFGQRVRAEREQRGWSQAELAKRLTAAGVTMSPSAVAKIEATGATTTERRAVKIEEASAFADLFGTTTDALMGRRARPRGDLGFALRGVQNAMLQAAALTSTAADNLRGRAADLRDMSAQDGDDELARIAQQAWWTAHKLDTEVATELRAFSNEIDQIGSKKWPRTQERDQ